MKNTTLCYIEQDGRYLMLHRNKKERDENKDKWIGVGGKFLENESPEDCLLREVWEETGLTLTRWQFRGIVTFVSDQWPTEYMHLFTADQFTGELQDCMEETFAGWKNRPFPSLPLWDGDRIFLDYLARRSPFSPSNWSTKGIAWQRPSATAAPCEKQGWQKVLRLSNP